MDDSEAKDGGVEHFLTFRDVAERMQSPDARIYAPVEKPRTTGFKCGFLGFCEWFEVKVHNAKALNPEGALKLLEARPANRFLRAAVCSQVLEPIAS